MTLSADARYRVARELIVSVDEEGQGEDARAAWGAEIESRVQEIVDGKVEMIDGDEAHRRLRVRLSKG